jgi:nucleoid-associated protein YgaU
MEPLRATARAKFKGFVEDNLRVAMENNSSPDLTHVREVKKGDTLPLMTFRIYGDSKYYLEVAKANNITNFRKLEVGQRIFFPPIEKSS